jgi:hypothetical protein
MITNQMRTIKMWTVTSPNGQVLTAEIDSLEPQSVILSSAAGNHGTVTPDVWAAKLAQMQSLGYTVVDKTAEMTTIS